MLWHCDACTTAYAWSAEVCPSCGSSGRHPQGDAVLVDRGGAPLCPHCRKDVEMAKNTRLTGASNAGDPTPTEPDAAADVEVEAEVEVDEPVTVEDTETQEEAPPERLAGNTPPRPAGNATTDGWAAYVTALGGLPDPDATRSELIALANELEGD